MTKNMHITSITMRKFLFIIIAMLVAVVAQGAGKEIPATDSNITFTGRTAKTSDGGVRYDWSGVYMQTYFSGSSVGVVVSEEGTSYHNVFVDGKLLRKIKVDGKTPHAITLASGLPKGFHRLMMQKCTEGDYGCTTVWKLLVGKGATLKPVPRSSRFIEVVGDSYTCGYGVEGKSPREPFALETEDCHEAYGALIARYFGADYALIAHSGQGIVRHWGDKQPTSENQMPERWTRIFDTHGQEAYDYKAYKPDIVIINLGTNDYSTMPLPSEKQYVGAYVKFIEAIKGRYGDIPILCVTPHSANIYLKAALGRLRDQTLCMSKVYMANPLDGIITSDRDLGSNSHPNKQGQTKIAFALIPQVAAITGWEVNQLPF